MDIESSLLDTYLTDPNPDRERKVHWFIECNDAFDNMTYDEIESLVTKGLLSYPKTECYVFQIESDESHNSCTRIALSLKDGHSDPRKKIIKTITKSSFLCH